MELIHHSGYIAIVGRPNVGKSTLINQLVRAKVSITSSKPQTTRHRILGIQERAGVQFVFIDTPGFQTRQGGALNQVLNRTVRQVLPEVDVIAWVIEAHQFTPADEQVLKIIAALQPPIPCVLVLNKIDAQRDRAKQMALVADLSARHNFCAVVPVSAQKNQGLDVLLDELARQLPEGERLYDAEQLSDRSDRFLAAELIREKLFRLTGDELPYTSTVVIDEFEQSATLWKIRATLLVEKEAHKAMVLGREGSRIKRIASEARIDMEKMWQVKVFLELWVKVKSGWADSEASLRAYGYE